MKRQLTELERKLEENGLKRNKESLTDLEEKRRLLKITIEFQKKLRAFEDVKLEYENEVRPYNRKVDDKNHTNQLEEIESQIKMQEEKIKIAETNLNEGVEIKNKKPEEANYTG